MPKEAKEIASLANPEGGVYVFIIGSIDIGDCDASVRIIFIGYLGLPDRALF